MNEFDPTPHEEGNGHKASGNGSMPTDEFQAPPGLVAEAGAPAARAAAPEPAKGSMVSRSFRHILSSFDLRGMKSRYGSFPLVALTILAVVDLFDDTAFGIALPEIQRHFRLNLTSLLTVFTYVGIVGILLTGPVGYLGDRWKRTKMSAFGGVLTSIGAILTPLMPGKAGLIMARTVGRQGQVLSSPVQFSLITDYYPIEERGKAFSFRAMGENFGLVLAPIFVGLVGTALGWQAPFIILGALGMVASLALLKLPEPTRGLYERLAYGADEETALREQEPPTWGEAWRAAWSIRTIRRIAYSVPFSRLASRGIAIFLYLYLQRVFGFTLSERGIIGAVSAGAGIIGLMVGGPLVSKFLGRNPGRVMIMSGMVSIMGAIALAGMALTRNFALAMTFIVVFGFIDAVIYPAQLSVYSSVIPPRLRGLALATLQYFALPAIMIGLPLIGYIGDEFGIRAGIIVLTPVSIFAAIIQMTAAPYVAFDIRSANSAAMAAEEYRRAKAAGRAKLLVIRDLDVHYESVQVVFGIDLDIEQGEIVALLGTNGAGKSTVLRAISGTQPATGGATLFDGRDITHVPPHEIAKWGIVHMPGGRGIFPGLTVHENLHLAGWMWGEEEDHSAEIERVFEYFPVLRERLHQKAGTLSGGEQQMLALGQAFLSRPRLLMIDELSMGLAPAIVQQLTDIIKAIHKRGTTVIIVEQSVNVALTIAERAVFMEKGEIRFDGPTKELLERPDLLRAVFLKGASATGRSLRVSTTSEDETLAARRADGETPAIIKVENVSKYWGGVAAVDGLSFDLKEGEILGVIGPNGAGKTSALEMVSGFVLPDEGRITYEGTDITYMPPDERARRRLVRRFQDARLFPALTVYETLAVAFERAYDTRSIFLEGMQMPQARVAEARVRRRVEQLIELLELGDFRDKFVSELSTGSRRIVDLACVLATDPKVLLLDEPSTGMAQREAEALVPLLLRIRRETACSMLVVEHDIPLISAVADELLAMVLGKAVIRGDADTVLGNEVVVNAYLGTDRDIISRSGT